MLLTYLMEIVLCLILLFFCGFAGYAIKASPELFTAYIEETKALANRVFKRIVRYFDLSK